MADPFGLFLGFVALLAVAFLAVYAYYESAGAPAPVRTRHGLTPRRSAVAVAVGVGLAVVVVAVGGRVSFEAVFASRRSVLRVGLWVVVLVGACEAVAGGYGFARRWWRCRPDQVDATGRAETGTTAVSGTVTDGHADAAPVTGRSAVCWSWSVSVTGPGLRRYDEDDPHRTVDGGTGGCPFVLDDGSGPLCVDPTDATLALDGERSVVRRPDSEPPDGFADPAPSVEADYADRPREYTEAVLRPGDTVTVWGAVVSDDDGPVLRGPQTTIVAGSPAGVARRYRRRAAGYALAGIAGGAVGVLGLLWSVGGL